MLTGIHPFIQPLSPFKKGGCRKTAISGWTLTGKRGIKSLQISTEA